MEQSNISYLQRIEEHRRRGWKAWPAMREPVDTLNHRLTDFSQESAET